MLVYVYVQVHFKEKDYSSFKSETCAMSSFKYECHSVSMNDHSKHTHISVFNTVDWKTGEIYIGNTNNYEFIRYLSYALDETYGLEIKAITYEQDYDQAMMAGFIQ